MTEDQKNLVFFLWVRDDRDIGTKIWDWGIAGSVEFVKPVRRKVKAREVLTGKRPVRA